MKLSPYQIIAFTHAARERSFSKAAAALGVTQSSVTQHVAKLEQIMGTQLFLRRREGLELTPTARELFDISDRMRTLEQLIEEKVEDYGELSAGHLRIVANAPRPAMPVIARYSELYPQVQIEFALVSWNIAMQQLREREIDIAIILEPEANDGISMREIGTTRYMAYVNRDHRLARRRRLSLKDLAEEVMILPEDGSLTQRLVKRTAAQYGVSYSRVVKTATFSTVKEAVLHGVGVGMLLEDSVFPSEDLIPIEIEEMTERYRNFLVTPIDKRDLRLVKSFCDVAVDETYADA